MPDKELGDDYNLPPEEGIEEEGMFDFGGDVLSRIGKKIRGDEENPSLLRRALSVLPALAAVPMMPSKSSASKAGKELKDVVKAFSFRKINPNEIRNVVSSGSSATKRALENMPAGVLAEKAKQAKEALGAKPLELAKDELEDILSHARKAIGD